MSKDFWILTSGEVDHTSREANYFRNRLEELNGGKLEPLQDAIIDENVFFLRIMTAARYFNELIRSPR